MRRHPLQLLAQIGPDTDAVEEAVPDGLKAADWIQAGVVIAAAVVVALVVSRLINRSLDRRAPGTATLVGRLAALVVTTVGFVYALSNIGVEVGLFVGALGVGGIALAFAFQDILENFIAGVILQVKRPFHRGAYVEIGESQHFGVVQEVDSRSVIIDTFGGDRIVLPAAEVLKNAIVNWTARGRHRLAVPVGVHYRTTPSDAIAAIEPRLDAIDEVLADPPPRVLLSSLDDSAVTLTVYVWHHAFADVFFVQHRVIEEAKAALDEAGIEIPFPQRVLSFASDDGANVVSVAERHHR
ncbi:MAG: mechanosensitive ion channel family protein [Acidimicrobiales bacterium]|nr:mechanosensitive ion channel family protein [Acidimicrobiales bacterium]